MINYVALFTLEVLKDSVGRRVSSVTSMLSFLYLLSTVRLSVRCATLWGLVERSQGLLR